MGFFSSLVDAFRSKPRARESIPLESPHRDHKVFQEPSSRHNGGHASSRTIISAPATDPSESTYTSIKRRSMSRRRSWFGGKPDADEDVPAVPALVRTDYNGASGIKSPTLGRSSRANGADYIQLPEDKRERRTSTFSHRQNATTVRALPPLPSIPVTTSYIPEAATSTLPAEQRRGRRTSMKSAHQRSNSQTSTKSRRRSRSFWASSNPDNSDEDVPPVPKLAAVTTPDSIPNDPFDDKLKRTQSRGRARSSIHGDSAGEPRPVSTASRRSYVPRSAAAGFLKSTNGASEDQRKSYRRSFNLGEGVELVCVTDEHRVEWEKLMNKNSRLEDSLFASMGKSPDEEQTGDRHSNAQALAALEFGARV